MLTYKQFRTKFHEENVGVESTKLTDEIKKLVDKWANDLKADLLGKSGQVPNRGIWDRFKNFLANIYHGYHSPNNPYYNINKFGYHLGSEAKAENLSLSDYKNLRSICENMENEINEQEGSNIRFMQIIDKYVDFLKKGLIDALQPLLQAIDKNPDKESNPPTPYTMSKEQEKAVASGQPETVAQHIVPPVDVNSTEKEISYSHTNPPTKNKAWADLSDEEKAAWNKFSGGVSIRSDRPGSLANLHGVGLPVVLRMGDPRTEIFKNIHPSQRDKRKSLFDHLVDQKRVETTTNPISTKQELDARVELIRQAYKTHVSPRQREPMTDINQPTPQATERPTPQDSPQITTEPTPKKEKSKKVRIRKSKPVETPQELPEPQAVAKQVEKQTRKDIQDNPQEAKEEIDYDISHMMSMMQKFGKVTDTLQKTYDSLPNPKAREIFNREMVDIIEKEIEKETSEKKKNYFAEKIRKVQNLNDLVHLAELVFSKYSEQDLDDIMQANEGFVREKTNNYLNKFRKLVYG